MTYVIDDFDKSHIAKKRNAQAQALATSMVQYRNECPQSTRVEYIRTILYYLTRATEKVSHETLEQALLERGPQGEQVMATIAQEYIQQGLERGRLEEKRNIARRLLKLHDVITVSEITGLSVEVVKALAETDNGCWHQRQHSAPGKLWR